MNKALPLELSSLVGWNFYNLYLYLLIEKLQTDMIIERSKN